MTTLLYQTDAYLQKFVARVIAIQDGALVLDRTAFYPGGGGQEPDKGTIEWQGHQYPLTKIKKVRDQVIHWIEGTYPIPAIDTEVHGLLDWDRRFKLMRTHTALHILCGVIWRDYGALVTGGNMRPLKARMDFCPPGTRSASGRGTSAAPSGCVGHRRELEHMSADFAAQVEAKINDEVAAAREVTVHTAYRLVPREEAFQIPDLIRTSSPRQSIGTQNVRRTSPSHRPNVLAGEHRIVPMSLREDDVGARVRVVEIRGLDLQADGGTHVANTREVGRIRIVKHAPSRQDIGTRNVPISLREDDVTGICDRIFGMRYGVSDDGGKGNNHV